MAKAVEYPTTRRGFLRLTSAASALLATAGCVAGLSAPPAPTLATITLGDCEFRYDPNDLCRDGAHLAIVVEHDGRISVAKLEPMPDEAADRFKRRSIPRPGYRKLAQHELQIGQKGGLRGVTVLGRVIHVNYA